MQKSLYTPFIIDQTIDSIIKSCKQLIKEHKIQKQIPLYQKNLQLNLVKSEINLFQLKFDQNDNIIQEDEEYNQKPQLDSFSSYSLKIDQIQDISVNQAPSTRQIQSRLSQNSIQQNQTIVVSIYQGSERPNTASTAINPKFKMNQLHVKNQQSLKLKKQLRDLTRKQNQIAVNTVNDFKQHLQSMIHFVEQHDQLLQHRNPSTNTMISRQQKNKTEQTKRTQTPNTSFQNKSQSKQYRIRNISIG